MMPELADQLTPSDESATTPVPLVELTRCPPPTATKAGAASSPL